MLKSPSVRSHSNPSDRAHPESYIQYYTQALRKKQIQSPNSYDEDQIEHDDPPKQYEEYLKRVQLVVHNPPNSPFLSKYYVATFENDQITLVSETSTETLNDLLKLRHQNGIAMAEEELLCLAFDMLHALKSTNLLYLSPSYIIKSWKIINHLEMQLQQDVRNWLESQEKLYFAPELHKYLEFELNDCDDFNQHLGQDIIAPKAALYSLGMILLHCIYPELSLDSKLPELLKTPKYSWSLRELITSLLREEATRPPADELLLNPLFHSRKIDEKEQRAGSQMSLSVFLNLVKSGYHNIDWADEFFQIEEIISISDLKEGLYPVGELKSEINQQIQQIVSTINQNCNTEELIQTIAKIAAGPVEKCEDQALPKKQQFLFKKWFTKSNQQQNLQNKEVVVQAQEPTLMAQILLLKLLSTASEKAFKACMLKYVHHLGSGLVFQNVRKICWPRALGLESQEAHREIVRLTFELCDYLSEAKRKDENQIDKDLARSRYSNQDAIKRTLMGFINQRHSNCYIQGMESISQVLLEGLGYDSELATICLQELYYKKIIAETKWEEWQDSMLQDLFKQKLQEKIVLYKWLLNYLDPQLAQHLREQDLKAETYVISWFSNFFAREFSINDLLKLYDHLLMAGENFEIHLAGAIMLELKATFQIKDSEGIFGCLKNLASNVHLQSCLQQALALSLGILKNFFTLAHQDEDECQRMKNENEYIKERPWDSPQTWQQIQQKQIFEITIFDLQDLLKEKEKNPYKVLPIDVRQQKEFEKASIQNSIFAQFQNKKIHSQLLTYLELRGQVEEDQIYYVVIVFDFETQNPDEIVDALLKMGIKKLCLLKGGIHSALMDGPEIIRQKCKAVQPPWLKSQIDELKKKLAE